MKKIVGLTLSLVLFCSIAFAQSFIVNEVRSTIVKKEIIRIIHNLKDKSITVELEVIDSKGTTVEQEIINLANELEELGQVIVMDKDGQPIMIDDTGREVKEIDEAGKKVIYLINEESKFILDGEGEKIKGIGVAHFKKEEGIVQEADAIYDRIVTSPNIDFAKMEKEIKKKLGIK